MRIEAHLEKNPAKVEKSAGKKVIFSSLALGQVPPFISDLYFYPILQSENHIKMFLISSFLIICFI